MNAPHSKYPLERQSSKRLIAWIKRDMKAVKLEKELAHHAAVFLKRDVALMHDRNAQDLRYEIRAYLNLLRRRNVRFIQTPEGYELL